MNESAENCWHFVFETECAGHSNNFSDAVNIWTSRPHILNKRVSVINQIFQRDLYFVKQQDEVIFMLLEIFRNIDLSNLSDSAFNNILLGIKHQLGISEEQKHEHTLVSVSLRLLYPSNAQKFAAVHEWVVKCDNWVVFSPTYNGPMQLPVPPFTYKFMFEENESNVNGSLQLYILTKKNLEISDGVEKYKILQNLEHSENQLPSTRCKRIHSESSETDVELPAKLHRNIAVGEKLDCIHSSNGNNFTLIKNDSVNEICNPSLQWLVGVVFKKIASWTKEKSEEENRGDSVTSTWLPASSLSLISQEKYIHLYQEMKKKYGLQITKIWPEKTDPLKYVYEDIAIAAYLLILWEQEREKKGLNYKQTFVDLGCGNGLLVHILASEGHAGVGLDVRKRKIWDLYGEETVLKETSIIPSSYALFPEADWLLGNHSDELTPWIPVMAARTSYKTNFFLLPCCAHDFDAKFQRASLPESNVGKSQYHNYLAYIRYVAETCGFSVLVDRLRIPSTKRICLVGMSRNYKPADSVEMDHQIKRLIASRSNKVSTSSSVDDGQWVPNFVARPKEEQVRNCTRLDNEVKGHVVEKVFEALLHATDAHSVEVCREQSKLNWNAGGSIHISDVASLLKPDILQKLKNECGGVQTLLRNHSHIFMVLGGQVRLRNYSDPKNILKRRSNNKKTNEVNVNIDKKRTKECWFHLHHPDGCSVNTDKCNFLHADINK